MADDMPKTKPGKGLRIALALSLAANLAVIGAFAGAVLRDGPGMRHAMVRDLGFGPYSEALSLEDRKSLRESLFDRAPEIRDTRQQARADAVALLQVLRADPLDAAALQAQMALQSDRMAKQLRLGQDLLVEQIIRMTTDERRAFADRLERGIRRGGPERDSRGD
jgi:uncharacterized membrane protein